MKPHYRERESEEIFLIASKLYEEEKDCTSARDLSLAAAESGIPERYVTRAIALFEKNREATRGRRKAAIKGIWIAIVLAIVAVVLGYARAEVSKLQVTKSFEHRSRPLTSTQIYFKQLQQEYEGAKNAGERERIALLILSQDKSQLSAEQQNFYTSVKKNYER